MKLNKIAPAIFVPIVCVASLIACGPGPSPGALGATIDAHGGYHTFFGYGTVEYDFTDFPYGVNPPYDDHHTIDLKNRNVHIRGEGYTVGFDGSEAWIENPEAFGIPARFYYNTPFYFFALPFAFGDPGANVEARGTKSVDGKSYEIYYVSFADGAGDTPDDDYVVYVDPETKQMVMASYIVTFPAFAQGKEPAELPRSAVAYEWQKLDNGLTVASALNFHAFDEELVLGPKAGTVNFENVEFKTERPEPALFRRTEAAVVDDSL